jgi:glycine betaine/proline transport system substrate-binding protein
MNAVWRWLSLLIAAAAVVVIATYIYRCGPQLTAKPQTVTAAGETNAAGPNAPQSHRTIRIGWTAWADAEVVTTLAEKLLEQRMGYQVDRVMTDIGIQYQAVAKGDLDIMLMAWLPMTHRNYWRKVRDKVVNLGPLYMGRLGWVVPDYIPKSQLNSITDLKKPEVAARIDHKIQGIDPGSGLMQASERAMKDYQLDNLKLVSASGAAMTAVLDRAYRQKKWVVVTGWQPHWMFARYKLRFLQDPKGALGGEERIHAIARQGFQNDFPSEVTQFFSRLYLPNDELAAILLDSQNMGAGKAVDHYIETHPERVNYWVTGKIAEPPEK